MKKIVAKYINFGLPNLTKKKKKPRNVTKCHTKKKLKNTIKCQNFFAIFFISNYGRSQFDILFFMSTTFSQQIFSEKLLPVLKLCIKKNKQKDNTRKLCGTLWILAHLIWLYILKKKSKNITKYHNIFTIHSLLGYE